MDRPYTIDHLDHIVLRVRDLERAEAFYAAIGGEVCIRRPENVSLQMSVDTRVTLKPEAGYEPPSVSSVDHLNFAVNADDINKVAAYLQSLGLDAEVETNPHSSPSVRMTDPDNNVVEIRLNGVDAAAHQPGGLRRAEA
ncbi:MAG: hypothetical protein HW416_728 [Chloroflexi bacterium]|nr:hypothetical protein [Chloroflexota bacterium]